MNNEGAAPQPRWNWCIEPIPQDDPDRQVMIRNGGKHPIVTDARRASQIGYDYWCWWGEVDSALGGAAID